MDTQGKLKGVHNAAVLVLDNKTREIVAYVGTENFDDRESQVDAVKALRSPGSTLKPFLYALQMERGFLTPKTRLVDVPYDAEGYMAENYDGMYSGLVYADEVLLRSLNVPLVRMLQQAGVPQFVEFTQNVGITSLYAQKDRLGLSMILGGCGVTLDELTAAYAVLASGGTYTKPLYEKANSSPVEEKRVLSQATAFMLTKILAGLDRPDLPNNFESSLNLPKVAFKTGTSYGRRDAWAIGYSAEYTMGVWIGNVTNRGNPELIGSKAAAPLLIDIFNSILSSHQKRIMAAPKDIRIHEVCANSGRIPTPRCKHRIEDYYSVLHIVHQRCDMEKEYMISADGTMHFCTTCLENHSFTIRTYIDYPPEVLNFWGRMGKTYRKPPSHNPLCTRLFSGQGPIILSPTQDMTFRTSRSPAY